MALLIVFVSSTSQAAWLATMDRAGFFGKGAIGFLYEIDQTYQLGMSLGYYTKSEVQYTQWNAVYRWTRWNIHFNKRLWQPFQMGAFVVKTLDNNDYFFNSPSKYPSPGYYDETALRWGFEIGSTVSLVDNLEFSYRLRLVDSGIIALINNAHRDLQYFASSGFSLGYRF